MHFSVAVITKGVPTRDTIEELMKPFCECYEPGYNEEFFNYETYEEDERENYEEDGYYYNPNAEYDWYSVGGRWAGYIKTKAKESLPLTESKEHLSWVWEGKNPYQPTKEDVEKGLSFVDCCRIKDIEQFDEFLYEKAKRYWEVYVESGEPVTEDDKQLKDFTWESAKYLKERYIDKERYANETAHFSTYAVLKDGEWYQMQEISSLLDCDNANDLPFYQQYFKFVFEDAEEDEYITIVDCHI